MQQENLGQQKLSEGFDPKNCRPETEFFSIKMRALIKNRGRFQKIFLLFQAKPAARTPHWHCMYYAHCTLLKTDLKKKKKELTKSARGIKTRFSPRRRENDLDLRIPNAQEKSSNVTDHTNLEVQQALLLTCTGIH
uniref:Uncharacterized protein n=1 Tax=Salix viminalis TaxID=40686 RepID=A0A6N2LTT7_SALVM